MEIYEEFNKKYNSYGWIADRTINQEIIIKCNRLNDIKKVDEFFSNCYTEELINKNICQYNIFKNCKLEKLPVIGTLFYKYFIDRDHLIKNALKDFLSQNYNSCIVLLLTIIDGITQDIDKKYGFFFEGINEKLELKNVDNINENSLQKVHELLYKSRNNTNHLEITIPFRNGILHGRDLNYGNKIVASKCWNILFALMYLGKNNNLYVFEKEKEKNTNPITIEEIKKNVSSDFLSFIEIFKECLTLKEKRYKLIFMDRTPTNIYSKNRRIEYIKRYFDNEFEEIIINDFKIINQTIIEENYIKCFIEIFFTKNGINYSQEKYIDFEYSDIDNKLSTTNNEGYWKTDLSILLGTLIYNAKIMN
ncbi:hypothetical protein AAX26_00902 [Aliarcobacter thereius]|uniref:hypothetical protein n=1 Tax=Aliarcobacter thereius TaxID=544718 RepID=UPI00082744EC|nr:hypothetical protein [Aliarcobacter thereius]OCL87809.1 hypothetical protein AAX26_00902 [Aliarcobacter thereius]